MLSLSFAFSHAQGLVCPARSVGGGEWCGEGRAPGLEGSYLTREFLCSPCGGGGGLCGGKKERVKSSVHMAPVFTMEKEGGHYLSLGSVLDTLWLC